jgi:hypothetical protein
MKDMMSSMNKELRHPKNMKELERKESENNTRRGVTIECDKLEAKYKNEEKYKEKLAGFCEEVERISSNWKCGIIDHIERWDKKKVEFFEQTYGKYPKLMIRNKNWTVPEWSEDAKEIVRKEMIEREREAKADDIKIREKRDAAKFGTKANLAFKRGIMMMENQLKIRNQYRNQKNLYQIT